MTRRSLLSAATVIPVIAAEAVPVLLMEWNRYTMTLNDGTVEKGIVVRATSASAHVRAFEVSVQWRERFLDLGPVHETRVLVSRDHDTGAGVCKIPTGGQEAWTLVQVWGLRQQEYCVSQVGSGS